jgi:hypothetical protein
MLFQVLTFLFLAVFDIKNNSRANRGKKMKAKFIPTGKMGVFYYESNKRSDRCYYITYKVGKAKKREKIGNSFFWLLYPSFQYNSY